MSANQRRLTDLMAVFGFVSAFVWCGAQILRAYTTLEGASLAQYISFVLSFALGFSLALSSRKENPGRIINQQLWLFGAWTVCGLVLLSVVATLDYRWTRGDTVSSLITAVGVVFTAVWATKRGLGIKSPMIRAWLSIFLKPVPQFLLVHKVFVEGGAGITVIAIVIGNVSIAMRLIPLIISAKTEGADKNKKWLIIAETTNQISWLAVTAVWLYR